MTDPRTEAKKLAKAALLATIGVVGTAALVTVGVGFVVVVLPISFGLAVAEYIADKTR